MTLDVSIQATRTDYRAQGTTVHLPPEVRVVRFNPPLMTRVVSEVSGDRRTLAAALRAAGYTVVWDDDNPARALGSRTSPARAAASRVNGTLSKGRAPSIAHVCPEPLKTQLLRMDKGTLVDLVYVAFKDESGCVKTVLETALRLRQEKEARDATPTP